MQNCYNSKRIARENLHEGNEKNKSESFQFIKDLGEQNRLLKTRIEELEAEHANCAELRTYVEESKEKMKHIQEQHLKQMDEVNAILAEKHKEEVILAEKHKEEIMKLVKEKLDQEQSYKDQIAKLKAQISQLEKTNRELLYRIDSMAESEEQVHRLKTDLDKATRKNKQYEDEITLMIEKLKNKFDVTNYISEIEELKKQNVTLSQDVRAKTQKIIELEFRLDKMEKEMNENSEDGDKITLIENLKVKVIQMQAERTIGTERERNYEKMIKELQSEVEKLQEALSHCEVAKHRLYVDYKKLLEEYQKLKEKYSSESQHKSFQDFVQLKRQLNHVKTENDDLKQVARTASGSSLPVLKQAENGASKKRGSGSYKKTNLKTLKE